MASRPDDPPESIVLGQFAGIKNTVSRERLAPGELESAINVDIDNAGQVRRRRGRRLLEPGNFHSLRAIAGQTFVVRNGVLGRILDPTTIVELGEGGPSPLSYTSVGSTVYFSSEVVSGKIVGDTIEPWGRHIDGGGEWVSPVIRPTETLGEIAGRRLSNPPMATEIEAYKGRIYLASGPVLWATELYLYDRVDRNRNYVHLPDDITMVRAVDDGLYVGTTKQLLFLRGTLSAGLSQSTVMNTPVIRGSATSVPIAEAHPRSEQQAIPEGDGPMFMTGAGICLGMPGGEVYNLTHGRVVFPTAQRAAVLCREDQGATSYVAVVDSAGGPSANARIGDYVDAEIVRASQRG